MPRRESCHPTKGDRLAALVILVVIVFTKPRMLLVERAARCSLMPPNSSCKRRSSAKKAPIVVASSVARWINTLGKKWGRRFCPANYPLLSYGHSLRRRTALLDSDWRAGIDIMIF